jgi:hypothetical protein
MERLDHALKNLSWIGLQTFARGIRHAGKLLTQTQNLTTMPLKKNTAAGLSC